MAHNSNYEQPSLGAHHDARTMNHRLIRALRKPLRAPAVIPLPSFFAEVPLSVGVF